MKKALIVIDVQNDYFKGGRFELVNAEGALNNIKKLVSYFHDNGLSVFLIQHISSKDGKFFVPGTEGIKIHESLCGNSKDLVITKKYPNSFFKTDLKSELDKRNFDELFICGMMTHMCVDTTVRAAFDYGYKVTLFSDACATRDLSIGEKVIDASYVQDTYMASLSGMFAKVVTTDNILKK